MTIPSAGSPRPRDLLMVVGGNDGGGISKTVEILNLDGHWEKSDCLSNIVREFPAKLEASMGAIIGEFLGWIVTWVGGFVKGFLRVPQLFCSFPAAQASKCKSLEIVYKPSYQSNDPP